MLQISECLDNGKGYNHDRHDLQLPSGDYCHKLTRDDLLKALQRTSGSEPRLSAAAAAWER